MHEEAALDQQEEDFRTYLEKNGVIHQLTRALVALYDERLKPGNAIEFIKGQLGIPSDVSIEDLKEENQMLTKKNEELRIQVEALVQQLQELRGGTKPELQTA